MLLLSLWTVFITRIAASARLPLLATSATVALARLALARALNGVDGALKTRIFTLFIELALSAVLSDFINDKHYDTYYHGEYAYRAERHQDPLFNVRLGLVIRLRLARVCFSPACHPIADT